jgi:hypothetical protein
VELIKFGHLGHDGLLVVPNINYRLAVRVHSGYNKIVGWLVTAGVLHSSNFKGR